MFKVILIPTWLIDFPNFLLQSLGAFLSEPKFLIISYYRLNKKFLYVSKGESVSNYSEKPLLIKCLDGLFISNLFVSLWSERLTFVMIEAFRFRLYQRRSKERKFNYNFIPKWNKGLTSILRFKRSICKDFWVQISLPSQDTSELPLCLMKHIICWYDMMYKFPVHQTFAWSCSSGLWPR